MDKTEFVKILTILGMAYNQEFTQEKASIWYGMFKNDNINTFKQAIKNLICKSKFMPSIAEVKEEMVAINYPSLSLNAEDEWYKVLMAIRKYGSYGQITAMNTFNNYTADIVRRIGWDRLCRSERIDFEKKLFIANFESLQNTDRELALLEKNRTLMVEDR